MPETKSEHVNWMVTSLLYQPAALGDAAAAEVIVGAVLSILRLIELRIADVSRCILDRLRNGLNCLYLCCLEFGLPGRRHPECRRARSIHVKWTFTLLLYQPDALGEVEDTTLIVGAVLSMFTLIVLLGALELPAVSITVSAVEVISLPSLLNLVCRAGTIRNARDRIGTCEVDWHIDVVPARCVA